MATSRNLPDLHLGYEIGTGKPVSIPLRNMVVTGQTQEAGKTTTLEALTLRAAEHDMATVAFVTKRGEGAFTNISAANGPYELEPYMTERADWQFVASVLEATMRERMKFERSWIIQASKGARGLADVQANVKRLMAKASGLSESVYMVLDAYLDIVVPRLAQVGWAKTLKIRPGLNVMDISERTTFPAEIQMLVIRSVLERIYESHSNTISILPEAWEFLPQERGSPVKLAATELVRKGSGLRNYVWLDSQDIGGVDKTMLRSCPVWLLGVQREANEIKRVLENIPAGIAKPKAHDIATLERGQFIACFGKTTVRVYVQPGWMGSEAAEQIARHPEQAHNLIPYIYAARKQPAPKEKPLSAEVIKALNATNTKLDRLLGVLEKQQVSHHGPSGPPEGIQPDLVTTTTPAKKPKPIGTGDGAVELQTIWEYVLDRLKHEAPKILAVMAELPELEIREQKVTLETDLSSALGMIAALLHEGFLDSTIKANSVWTEMKRRWNYGGNSARAYEQLDKLTSLGFVTKEPGGGYTAVPGIKKRIRRVET